MKNACIFELAGLPGAGKTTLVNQVKIELNKQGYKCYGVEHLSKYGINGKSTIEKLYVVVRFSVFCLLKPRTLFYLTLLVLSIKPIHRERIKFAKKFLVLLFLIRQATRNMGCNEVLLLDQGIFQNLWSILVLRDNEVNKKHLYELIQKVLEDYSLKIIFLRIGVDKTLDRITMRSSTESRFDLMNKEIASRLLHQYDGLFNILLTIYQELSQDFYMKLDAEDSIKKNVYSLAKEVKKNIKIR